MRSQECTYPIGSQAQIIHFQMDPNVASAFDVDLARVPLNKNNLNIGHRWECSRYEKLYVWLGEIIEKISITQLGGYDDGQPWP